MRNLAYLAAAVLTLGLLSGCSGSSDSTGSGSGGSSSGGSTGSGGTSGGSGGSTGGCTTITNIGGVISPSSNSGAPPAMTGGTIADGTYTLVSWIEYNGASSSSSHQETFQFSGNTFAHVQADPGGGQTPISGTYTTSGTTITLNATCPTSQSISLQYTATASIFSFVPPDDPNRIQSYDLQN